ncbi:hypothetical protein H6G20_25475 [Desertifilum sp. FACHB-1129]|uniref:Uncharacterized protein n=2 Tax=Desertifilum tharense IPPAS B-1220 TaxID=1781255 RepID=A0A1E5QE94_9CYAN|nr:MULTISPECIES: hypothetical protein [Desertifilum]MCD8490233.1 hypothetical protein [Desertifilum sp.]MDA0211527.1 hypothetical protein [Cyanobacteria bacterium FC1]MBD2315023.1 hypothetical protein [Desertifilum sp. FACHB-1129]MBD2324713.1 hypothetical protein [Desertifilum sp. FACHB-866]MBD2334731.1 hypothetical protein [Desertifilum sp. FACHB-868]
MEKNGFKYRMLCTLTFGDIYGQIITWLIVIMVSLAAALALMGASRPVYALATVGLILVLSLPFLLFAFVTTLLNHIEFLPIEEGATTKTPGGTLHEKNLPQKQKPAEASS